MSRSSLVLLLIFDHLAGGLVILVGLSELEPWRMWASVVFGAVCAIGLAACHVASFVLDSEEHTYRVAEDWPPHDVFAINAAGPEDLAQSTYEAPLPLDERADLPVRRHAADNQPVAEPPLVPAAAPSVATVPEPQAPFVAPLSADHELHPAAQQHQPQEPVEDVRPKPPPDLTAPAAAVPPVVSVRKGGEELRSSRSAAQSAELLGEDFWNIDRANKLAEAAGERRDADESSAFPAAPWDGVVGRALGRSSGDLDEGFWS